MSQLRCRPSRETSIAWSIDRDELAALLARQLSFFALRPRQFSRAMIAKYLPEAQERVARCFTSIRKKYYFEAGRSVFNHAHGDHWATLLYFLGNTIHRAGGDSDLATATFALNKMLHGLDAHFSIELPAIFLLVHPLGTVLGGARYRDYFMVYQNCTVGSTEDGRYPEFSEGTVLFSGASVIGACRIGSNVVFGANSFLLSSNVPPSTTVVGSYPMHRFLPNPHPVCERMFR